MYWSANPTYTAAGIASAAFMSSNTSGDLYAKRSVAVPNTTGYLQLNSAALSIGNYSNSPVASIPEFKHPDPISGSGKRKHSDPPWRLEMLSWAAAPMVDGVQH